LARLAVAGALVGLGIHTLAPHLPVWRFAAGFFCILLAAGLLFKKEGWD